MKPIDQKKLSKAIDMVMKAIEASSIDKTRLISVLQIANEKLSSKVKSKAA